MFTGGFFLLYNFLKYVFHNLTLTCIHLFFHLSCFNPQMIIYTNINFWGKQLDLPAVITTIKQILSS